MPKSSAKKPTSSNQTANPLKRKARQESEQKLIAAAIKIFGKYGFEESSVHTVAEESGVNVSLINRYFGGKEGLLQAIAEKALGPTENILDAYPAQSTLHDELLAYAKAELRSYIESKHISRILISRALVDPSFRKHVLRVLEKNQDDVSLSARLERLKEAGHIDAKVDVQQLQLVFGLQVFSTLVTTHCILGLNQTQVEEILRSFVKFFAEGVNSL